MSLNLYIGIEGTDEMAEFPFQTGTSLTREVINETDKNKQLTLLKNEIESWNWDDDETAEMVERITKIINAPHLKLTYM